MDLNTLRSKWESLSPVCARHAERMQYAAQALAPRFPLQEEEWLTWPAGDVALMDQWIYRFTKLQDTLGQRLFDLVLEVLAEDARSLPMIDKLGRLEQFGMLDARQWLELREFRNLLTHEYPDQAEEFTQTLNLLSPHSQQLLQVWHTLRALLSDRLAG